MSKQKPSPSKRKPTAAREIRIAHIADLMRANKWRHGVTAKELAAEWGLELQTVWLDSAEASKRVRAEVNDPDAVSAHVGVVLMTALDDEMAKGRKRNGKVVADLAKTWATIAGAGAPTKVEHSGPNGGPIDIRAAQDELLGRIARIAESGGSGTPDPKPDGG